MNPNAKEVQSMLKNLDYNIIESISIISKSLHRYDTYLSDLDERGPATAGPSCESCRAIWQTLKAQREKELNMLVEELKQHVAAGNLDVRK
jgi:Fe-S cluster biogenesis protein NfuA